jgi:hypothetical protein
MSLMEKMFYLVGSTDLVSMLLHFFPLAKIARRNKLERLYSANFSCVVQYLQVGQEPGQGEHLGEAPALR